MARECFCGCGRRLGFKDRALSRRAAKIQVAADFLEEHGSRFGPAGVQEADLEGFINDGRVLRDQLVAVLHGQPRAQPVDRQRIAHWRRRAKGLINAYNMATYAPISGVAAADAHRARAATDLDRPPTRTSPRAIR